MLDLRQHICCFLRQNEFPSVVQSSGELTVASSRCLVATNCNHGSSSLDILILKENIEMESVTDIADSLP